jgi:hypothetical protein
LTEALARRAHDAEGPLGAAVQSVCLAFASLRKSLTAASSASTEPSDGTHIYVFNPTPEPKDPEEDENEERSGA